LCPLSSAQTRGCGGWVPHRPLRHVGAVRATCGCTYDPSTRSRWGTQPREPISGQAMGNTTPRTDFWAGDGGHISCAVPELATETAANQGGVRFFASAGALEGWETTWLRDSGCSSRGKRMLCDPGGDPPPMNTRSRGFCSPSSAQLPGGGVVFHIVRSAKTNGQDRGFVFQSLAQRSVLGVLSLNVRTEMGSRGWVPHRERVEGSIVRLKAARSIPDVSERTMGNPTPAPGR